MKAQKIRKWNQICWNI